MNDPTRVRQVLAGQRFPAARWELITTAEFYGADEQTRRDLRALDATRFPDLAAVLRAVAAARAIGTPG